MISTRSSGTVSNAAAVSRTSEKKALCQPEDDRRPPPRSADRKDQHPCLETDGIHPAAVRADEKHPPKDLPPARRRLATHCSAGKPRQTRAARDRRGS